MINYKRLNVIHTIVIIIAIYNIRQDIKIICDHFTFTSLIYAIKYNILSLMIIFSTPYLIKRYQNK